MIVFLVSSVFAFIFFNLIIAIIVQKKKKYTVFAVKGVRIVLSNTYVIFGSYLILFLMAVFLSYFVFVQIIRPSHYLYSAYDLMSSRMAGSIAVGIAFGALFAIWLRRLYKKDGRDSADAKGREFTLAEKIEGFVLLVLFILGTTSFTVADLVSGLQVDSPIVKFQLQNNNLAGVGVDQNLRSASTLDPTSLVSKPTRENHARKVAFTGSLMRLDEQINRDRRYIDIYVHQHFRSEYGKCLEAYQVPKPKHCSDRYEEGIHNAVSQMEILEESSSIVRTRLSPYFECLDYAYSITRDEQYIQGILRKLMPSIREFYHAARIDGLVQGEIERMEGMLANAIAPVAAHVARISEISDVPEKCKSGIVRNAWNFVRNFALLTTQLAIREAGVMRGQAEKSADLSVLKSAKERPYLALTYAYAHAQLNDFQTAINVLDDWVRTKYGRRHVGQYETHEIAFWFLFRVRSVQISLYKEWKKASFSRNLQAPMSQEDFREYMDLLDRVVEAMNKIDAIAERNRPVAEAATQTDEQVAQQLPNFKIAEYDGVVGRTLEAVGFLREPKLEGCAFARDLFTEDPDLRPFTDKGLKFLLAGVYYHNIYLVGLHGTEHPDYGSVRARSTNETLSELVNTDFSCMLPILGPDEFEVFRAEVFRAYGLARVREIKLRKKFDDGYQKWLEQRLELAGNAFEISKDIIYDGAQRKRKVRENANELSVRQKISHHEWLLRDLNDWIDRVEAVSGT
ncbi:hypothetical protein [Roseibium sp.]|uniref:hypothetical protein n=1 Tax=Roseibium sp. TaxID=1936156 RepID=UPI003B508974